MSITTNIHEIEAILDDIRSEWDHEVAEMQAEIKNHQDMIEERSETIQELQEQNEDAYIQIKYLEAKVFQLEMELVEAISNTKKL